MSSITEKMLVALLALGACSPKAKEHAAAPVAAPMTAEHCAAHKGLAAAEPLPGQSIYNLSAQLRDHRDQALALDAFVGSPVLVTMFYSSCTSICPMLIARLQEIDKALSPGAREQTRLLLISLDPQRDTVAKLAELAKRHGIDDPRWHFTRTEEPSVREIAAVLGIRYKQMPDGGFSHSPLISLVDGQGVVKARLEGSGGDIKELTTVLEAMLPKP